MPLSRFLIYYEKVIGSGDDSDQNVGSVSESNYSVFFLNRLNSSVGIPIEQRISRTGAQVDKGLGHLILSAPKIGALATLPKPLAAPHQLAVIQ